MEKSKPTYDIDSIKAAFDDPDKLEITNTALLNASKLGYDRHMIVATVQSIKKDNFYKSMTSNHNSRIWQDVYHVPSDTGMLYIKFTSGIISDFLLLSFKNK